MGTHNIIAASDKWKDLDEKIEAGLQKTAEILIKEEKKKNGYILVAGDNGTVKKIPAKDL